LAYNARLLYPLLSYLDWDLDADGMESGIHARVVFAKEDGCEWMNGRLLRHDGSSKDSEVASYADRATQRNIQELLSLMAGIVTRHRHWDVTAVVEGEEDA